MRFTFSQTHVGAEDKLDVIRRLDSSGSWESLDDRRYCTVCKKTFSGRQIEALKNGRRLNRLSLQCPTLGCDSTPNDWKPARAPRHRAPTKLIPFPT